MSLTANSLRTVTNSARALSEQIKSLAFSPDSRKILDLKFGPSMAAQLIGRTPEALAKAEAKGRLPQPKLTPNGRRYYNLEDLTHIRQALGIQVGKQADEDAVVLAVQNFKGGVGKSTITKHFADYLALQGYKVLVVDCDPQASTTTMFDIQPETMIDVQETLGEYLSPRSDFDDLSQAICDTPWPNTKIIPSCLSLQDAEWDLTATLKGDEGITPFEALQRLKIGLEPLRKQFDVILLDPPPALGFLGLNVMASATALLVPVPPRLLDYLSTTHFMETIADNIDALASVGVHVEFPFFGIVCSAYSPNKPGEHDMWRMMEATYAYRLLKTPLLASEEIKNATQQFSSIYECKPHSSQQTYNRCRENLDAVFSEVLKGLRDQWPSTRMSAQSVGEAA